MDGAKRQWSWTWHGYTEDDVNTLKGITDVRYLVFQQERCPETGALHLQGFIALMSPQRMTGVKKILDPKKGSKSSIHLESSRGTADQNRAYCTKEDTRVEDTVPYEYGSLPSAGKKKDWSVIMDDLASASSVSEFASLHPEEAIKHHAGVVGLHSALRTAARENAALEKLRNVVLNPTQTKMMEIILGLEGRSTGKVVWFFDDDGQSGKTTICKHLIATRGTDHCLYLQNGRTQDLAHAWSGHELILFDLPRSLGEERLNVGALEALSNGIIFSGKYASAPKIIGEVLVVVFANMIPPWASLSRGRWIAWSIDKGVITPLADPRA